MDNGAPWATWADLPPALPLWWLDLGIAPIWNPPRQPRKNPFVERCNGLVEPWGEPATCPDYATWSTRLEWIAVVQRERYPAVAGQTRAAAYPALGQNSRSYRAAAEAEQFDLDAVKAHLAQGRWPRRASKIGQITLYGRPYRLGRRWAGQQVWFQFDPATTEWVVLTEDGQEIRRHAAAQVTTARIIALDVAQPRPLSKKAQQRRNLAAHHET